MKKLPLEGIRVADLTMMWAGPFATKLLGEMGAEVLKIESPSAWDNIRTLIPQPGVDEPWNSSYYFNTYNHDKKSVTLDLAQEAGKDVFLQLVAHCDVVIENYRADVLDKLGIGWDALHAANPRLVIVSMAGFGKTGADADLVGFGPVIEMMSGLTSLTGYGDDGVPYKCGVSYGDPVAGKGAAAAVVLGLIQRRRTGSGCVVDLAQREVAATLAGGAFAAASARGEQTPHQGNRDARFAPQGCYRTLDRPAEGEAGRSSLGIAGTNERWIALSVRSDTEWAALAELIARPDLAALPFSERRARHDELDDVVSDWCRDRDAAATVEALQAAGIPAAQVLDMVDIGDDPHLAARAFWSTHRHPRMPAGWKQPAPGWRLIEANPQIRAHAPLFGQHTREVLGGLVGLDDAALEALAAANVIADAPINPGVG